MKLINLLFESHMKYHESGFIDPDGTFYECEDYAHGPMSLKFVERYYGKNILLTGRDPMNILYHRGWIRIADGTFTLKKLDDRTAINLLVFLKSMNYSENERVSVFEKLEVESGPMGYISTSIKQLEDF